MFKSKKPISKTENFLVWLTFLFSFIFASVIISFFEYEQHQEKQRALEIYGTEYAQIISHRFEMIFYPLDSVGLLIKETGISNQNTQKKLPKNVDLFLKKYSYIQKITLAPQGVISDIEPLLGNEKALGLNILERPEESAITHLAKETKKLTISTPIELVQGGKSIVGFLPVFDDQNKFWGFVAMIVNLPDILQTIDFFSPEFIEKYDIQISKETLDPPSSQIIYSNREERLRGYTVSISVPNDTWQLTISPKIMEDDHYYYAKIFAAFLISITLMYYLKLWLQTRTLKNYNLTHYEKYLVIDNVCITAETNTKGIITFVSNSFVDLTGYSEEELIGKPISILKSGVHDKKYFDTFWHTITRGESSHLDVCNRKKNGELYWAFNTVVPILDSHGKKIIKFFSIMVDITKLKRTIEENEKLQSQLFQKQKLESIGQLTSGIAHDFNNILTSSIGFTDLALGYAEVNNVEKIIPALQKVKKMNNRAAELVDKMLIFTREKTIKALHPIDPAVVVHEVIEISKMLRPSITSSVFIELNNELSKNISEKILIDPTELHQIVTNLIVNARDAIETGDALLKSGGMITVSLFAKNYQEMTSPFCNVCGLPIDGKFLVLSVQDTGSGMAPEKISRIFEPFFTTKEVGKGTGLGLSVVTGIVHNAHGHILVTSHFSEGTTFTLLFPVVESHEPELDTQRQDNEEILIPKISDRKLRVCFVDDEEDICALRKEELTQFNYEIQTFVSSLSAWEYFQKNPYFFDVVITDYGMPLINGFDLATEMLLIRPELPILICTGFSDKLKTAADLPEGNTFLFNKPVLGKVLDKTIREFFGMFLQENSQS